MQLSDWRELARLMVRPRAAPEATARNSKKQTPEYQVESQANSNERIEIKGTSRARASHD